MPDELGALFSKRKKAMIIHEPRVTEQNGKCRLSAKIETARPRPGIPETLWFQVDKEYAPCLLPRADAFLAALLPVASEMGEDIEIRGAVSPKLLYGAREYLRITSAQWPRFSHFININATRLSPAPTFDAASHQKTTGCAFSGGIDAFYTLWSHLPKNETIPDYRITHALIVNGFDLDVDMDETEFFPALKKIYGPLFDELKIPFVAVTTNVQVFRRAGIRRRLHSYASPLTACALALGPLFQHFFISSSYKYGMSGTVDDLRPIIDPLLSTEATDILYGGADATRYERLKAISAWPATYSRLRVCTNTDWRNIDAANTSVVNCCRCSKCLLTQIAIELLGASDNYSTFPGRLSRKVIRQYGYDKGGRIRIKEYLAYAKQTSRKDLVFDLRYAYWHSTFRIATKKLKKILGL